MKWNAHHYFIIYVIVNGKLEWFKEENTVNFILNETSFNIRSVRNSYDLRVLHINFETIPIKKVNTHPRTHTISIYLA